MRVLLLTAALLRVIASAGAQERFDFESVQMATKFRISMHAENREVAEKAADEAFARVAALTAIFSDYEPLSELSRLNALGAGKPFPASAELWELVSRSNELSKLTDGAFDITCGQLTRLWRGTRVRKKLPPHDRLASARESMDWKSLKLDQEAKTITITKPGQLLDAGGIAKGYAADEALRVLREKHHITRALVIAGGDIAIGDAPPGEEGWEITLRTFIAPIGGGAEKKDTLRLHHCGVSTSGDHYQFIVIDGVRYAHIISPKTGLGLTESVACSVIAPDCTTSDALATAMCVLGKEEGTQAAARIPGVRLHW